MTAATATTKTATASQVFPARRPRLSRGWRKATLVAHIVTAGGWIGIDVIVAVLVFTGWFADDVAVRSLAYQALATFVVWPMLTAGLACLATGPVLGVGSRGGWFGTGGSRSSSCSTWCCAV